MSTAEDLTLFPEALKKKHRAILICKISSVPYPRDKNSKCRTLKRKINEQENGALIRAASKKSIAP